MQNLVLGIRLIGKHMCIKVIKGETLVEVQNKNISSK